jgi:hypothetical protein
MHNPSAVCTYCMLMQLLGGRAAGSEGASDAPAKKTSRTFAQHDTGSGQHK